MRVKELLTINVIDCKTVKASCHKKDPLHCPAFCLLRYVWPVVVNWKFFFWNKNLINLSNKYTAAPIFCFIGSLKVKYDAWSPFSCHSIVFLTAFPVRATSTIHKPKDLEFAGSERDNINLSFKAAQFSAKLLCSPTEILGLTLLSYLTKDLIGEKHWSYFYRPMCRRSFSLAHYSKKLAWKKNPSPHFVVFLRKIFRLRHRFHTHEMA